MSSHCRVGLMSLVDRNVGGWFPTSSCHFGWSANETLGEIEVCCDCGHMQGGSLVHGREIKEDEGVCASGEEPVAML
jgi:hypothetical protein